MLLRDITEHILFEKLLNLNENYSVFYYLKNNDIFNTKLNIGKYGLCLIREII